MRRVSIDPASHMLTIVDDEAGTVAQVSADELLREANREPEKPARNIFDEPFATTRKQVEAWWPTRRRS